MEGEKVKKNKGGNKRILIWGEMEERMKKVDEIVIGGLKEGRWKKKKRNEKLMQRKMKEMIEIDKKERRKGIEENDLKMEIGMENVVMKSQKRQENEKKVNQRWMKRIEKVMGEDVKNEMRGRGKRLINWQREIEREEDVNLVRKKENEKNVEESKKNFQVKEIEKMRREKYEIFEKKIMKMRKMEKMIRDKEEEERGKLFKEIMGNLKKEEIDKIEKDEEEKIMEIGRIIFEDMDMKMEIEEVWWKRFKEIIKKFMKWEREREYKVKERFEEIEQKKREVENIGIKI